MPLISQSDAISAACTPADPNYNHMCLSAADWADVQAYEQQLETAAHQQRQLDNVLAMLVVVAVLAVLWWQRRRIALVLRWAGRVAARTLYAVTGFDVRLEGARTPGSLVCVVERWREKA